jgi:hypothetical protein
VTLTATPAVGALFANWSGACSGHAARCSFVASRDSTARAHFLEDAVALTEAEFDVEWNASRVAGDLVVSGRARAAARLVVRVAPTTSWRSAVGAGPFVLRLPVPPRLLPGRYVISVGGIANGEPIVERRRVATLSSPPEGVVARAYISAAKAGEAAARLAGPQRVLWSHFEFAVLPDSGSLTVTWYGPDGHAVAAPVVKARRRAVDSFARSARGALRTGRWRCVLRAGGVDVATAQATLG